LDSSTASFHSDLRRVADDMRDARARLLALIGRLSPDDLARSRPGGWSAGRVLQHVIESEAVYVKLLAHQTGGAAPELASDEPATASDASSMLAATRDAVERMIDGISEATLYRLTKIGHEEYSPLSVLENIASHDRDHVTQIEDLLRAVGAGLAPPVAERAPPPNVTVRAAMLDDLPRLTEIYNHYIVHTPITFDLEPFSVEQRRAWFDGFAATGRRRLLVAVDTGAVVAFAGSSQFRAKAAYDTTVETTVYCAPGATGRGIGAALYAALFDALRGEDIRLAVAGITVPNEASIALHERFGFAPVGLMHGVGRKFGKMWDVAWYERRIG
jgi:phosphinothricin acetyltransferase